MRSVIIAWYKPGKYQFEDHVPLKFLGERNLHLGYSNKISIVFLEGLELLDLAYREALSALGFELTNAEKYYRILEHDYKDLARFGDYERKCFLRWLVIKKQFPGEQVIHYDGDIVFNEDPEKIAQLLKGTTFVLQGCPALTAISDTVWLDQYEAALNEFYPDMQAYSDSAWKERAGWEISKFERWAGERYREMITSDQDLISHLMHTRRIKQDPVSDILKATQGYILIQNPVLIHEHHDDKGFRYERRNEVDYLNDKRVLIWHMQSDFVFYLALFLYRKNYTPIKGQLDFWENKRSKVIMYIFKLLSKLSQQHHRKYIYDQFFKRHDFSDLFNNVVWWKSNVFK